MHYHKKYKERKWKINKSYLTKASGRIIKSDIPVGIELEVVGKDETTSRVNIFKLNRHNGITTDMSIRNNILPTEIQTPPASGIALERLVDNTCASLLKDGFLTNKDCGTHIHIGLSKKYGSIHKNPIFYKNLFFSYFM